MIAHYEELIGQLEEELENEPEKDWVQRYLAKTREQLERAIQEKKALNKHE